MQWQRFWAAGLLLAGSIGMLWYAANGPEGSRCSAEGVGPLPFLALLGMLVATLLAFSAMREAYGWPAVPAGLLFGATAVGLLCSCWLATLGGSAFTGGCV
ncbi:hypothetical protein ACQP00_06420 [Dactylosporangium sp. CS-047395]|uniref:hypothetical protein n=1 Tax=Dactylosporangium sp. CS-047395 TaxID=3239936 RepID=UPI003D90BB1E